MATVSSRLYLDPARPTASSTLRKLVVAVKKKKLDDIRDCLEKQDEYTLHRPIRKRFARKPYPVRNVTDVWECHLVDVRALGKFNDNYKYILSVIDVFSKFLHLVSLRSKTGTVIASAFISIFGDSSRRRRAIWVRKDKGKEFLNEHFQEKIKREVIQFQVCRNPDVQCSVVERAHRTIHNGLYKYFTYKNANRYIDVLPKFVRANNGTIHSATGMAPWRATDSDVLVIWKRMEAGRRGVRVTKATFRVRQHVRISKEKMKFAKSVEQNFSTKIFRIAKAIERRPRPLYELEDFNGTLIEGQFYQEELTRFRVPRRTVYKIDKKPNKRVRRGILEYLVRWRCYSKDFDSWIPASNVIDVPRRSETLLRDVVE